jgi:hypothetical protein
VIWADLDTAATIPANIELLRKASFTGSGSVRWPQSNHVGCSKFAPSVCVVSGWSKWYVSGDVTLQASYENMRPVSGTEASAYQAHTPTNFAVEAIYGIGGTERYRLVTHTRGQFWDTFTGGATDPDAYNNTPRANISPDGNWVAYATQFGATNPAADLRVVLAHIGADPTKQIRFTAKTATTATLRYVAPSTTACAVTVDDTSTFASPLGSYSAVADTPAGKNERSMALTGLTTNTLYYVRVTCAAKNADTTFRTR